MKNSLRNFLSSTDLMRLMISFLGMSFFSANLYALESVTLQLKWKHQFQFAGYYMAKELGIYESAGLDVTIIEAQPGMKPIEEVLQGKADFGVGTSDLVRYRAEGHPVVVLGVIFQHSPTALLLPQKQTPYSIHDIAALPVMIESHAAEIWAYFQNEGIDIEKINSVEHSFDVEDIIAGKAKAMSIYVTDEPFVLQEKAFDYQLFHPLTAGIDFYGDNLFTTETLMSDKPEVVEAFLKASVSGWKYAMSHQVESIDIIRSRYSRRHSKEHLLFEAEKIAALMQPEIVEPGYMNKGRWLHIIDTYIQLGMIDNRPDLDDFLYTKNNQSDLSGLYQTIFVIVLILVIIALLLGRFIWMSWRLSNEIKRSNEIEKELRISANKIELAKTEAELANSFKSQFLASIGHDLRTPLTAIIGFAEQALLNYRKTESCEKDLESVLNNSHHIQQMIDELSDLAQVESGSLQLKPVMLNLQSLLQELDAVMKGRAQEKNIQYQMQLNWPIPELLFIDATRLRRVLINLLTNAIKFTDNGSVSFQVSATDGHLLCKIMDTGIGIDESLLGDLFKPFIQANENIKANYGGTGLGLYITRELVEKMGGVIGVDSKPGQGSCFYIKLPIGIDKPEMISCFDDKKKTVADIATINKKVIGRLLVVEDVEENRNLLAVMLDAPTLEVSFVNDGLQALEKIETQPFDLVLMDIQMPVMTGTEAVVELRNRGDHLPVIALSANMSDKQKDEYLESGFDGVLAKPIDRSALFRLLEDYLLYDFSGNPLDNNENDIDQKAIEKLRYKFVRISPSYVSEFIKLFENNDYVGLARAAHRYIGSSGSLGFENISQLLLALESSSDDQDREACEETLKRLRHEVELL